MSYLKSKIRKILKWAASGEQGEKYYADGSVNTARSIRTGLGGEISSHNNALNLTVYTATGGKVIQVKTYDHANDAGRSTLYVITDKEDLGNELAQIITIESLSR